MTKSIKKRRPLEANPTEVILESISDGVFTVVTDWRITSFNRAAEEITGIKRQEAMGRICSEVFRCSMCETECAFRRTIQNGKPIIGKSGYIIGADGHRLPISFSTAVLKDTQGNVVGGAETFRDLSEVEAAAPGTGGTHSNRRPGEPQPFDAEALGGAAGHRGQHQHRADLR